MKENNCFSINYTSKDDIIDDLINYSFSNKKTNLDLINILSLIKIAIDDKQNMIKQIYVYMNICSMVNNLNIHDKAIIDIIERQILNMYRRLNKLFDIEDFSIEDSLVQRRIAEKLFEQFVYYTRFNSDRKSKYDNARILINILNYFKGDYTEEIEYLKVIINEVDTKYLDYSNTFKF